METSDETTTVSELRKLTAEFVAERDWSWIPVPAFLIEHPQAGALLVDTGLHPLAAAEPKHTMGRIANWLYETAKRIAKNIKRSDLTRRSGEEAAWQCRRGEDASVPELGTQDKLEIVDEEIVAEAFLQPMPAAAVRPHEVDVVVGAPPASMSPPAPRLRTRPG